MAEVGERSGVDVADVIVRHRRCGSGMSERITVNHSDINIFDL